MDAAEDSYYGLSYQQSGYVGGSYDNLSSSVLNLAK